MRRRLAAFQSQVEPAAARTPTRPVETPPSLAVMDSI
jgi:hypothetical protein